MGFDMSQHVQYEEPSGLSIVIGWLMVAATMTGTAYVAIGVESWRETVGFGLGLFASVLILAQVSGRMIERNQAQERREREAARERLAADKGDRLQVLPPVHRVEEDDETRRLVVPGMRPGGSVGGPVERSPRRVEDQLRVGMRFRTEEERAAWQDAPTEIMRWRGGEMRTGRPGYDGSGGTAGMAQNC